MMKYLLIITALILLNSCKRVHKDYTNKDIDDKIIEFYKSINFKDYQPIYFTKLDTVKILKDNDGRIIKIVGEVRHGYTGTYVNKIKDFTEEFSVIILDDKIIVKPNSIK